jgi:hypothetical protein
MKNGERDRKRLEVLTHKLLTGFKPEQETSRNMKNE